VLFITLIATTAWRFINTIIVLTVGQLNLPTIVMILTPAMILYGVGLLVKKFLSTVRVRQYLIFFAVHSLVIAFNIAFVAITSPLAVTIPEAMVVGTLLDLIIFVGLAAACIKQLSNRGFTAVVVND